LLLCLFCVNAVDEEAPDEDDPLKHIKPENPLKDLKPENPLKDLQPENPLKDLKPENPLKDLKPENPLKDLKPENPLKDLRPEEDPFKNLRTKVKNFTGFYEESFDSLSNEGFDTYSQLPFNLEGWSSNRHTYMLSDGSRTTCGLYSFGRILKHKIHNQKFVETDRALGAMTNRTIDNVWFGVSLNNANNTNITKINISFWGELWKSGGASNLSRYLLFSMRIIPLESCLKVGFEDDVVTNSVWLGIPDLDFETPEIYHHEKKIDGKQPRNRGLRFTTLNVMSWPQNSVLQLRWEKPYLGGRDDALAIDDLKVEVRKEKEQEQEGEGKGTSKMGWKTWTVVIIVVVVVVVLAILLVVMVRKQKRTGYTPVS